MVLLTVWLAVVLYVSLAAHPTPLYSSESDTVGVYIPAARDLTRGHVEPGLYQTKGAGYPLVLAAAGFLTRGDYYLAARLLNVVAAVAAAASTFLLFRAFLGLEGGWFVLAGLLLNPVFLRFTIEAGSDVPAFALAITATFLLLCVRRTSAAFAAGLLAGLAVITRYSALLLPVAGIATLAIRPQRGRNLAAYAAGLALPLVPWAIAASRLGLTSFGTGNVTTVAYEMYGRNVPAEFFWSTSGTFHSIWEVLRHDPAVALAHIGANLGTRWLQDLHLLVPVWLGVLAVPGLFLRWGPRPGWRGVALHMALAYAVLAVFLYLPRYGLYLIPFYLAAAVSFVLDFRLGLPRERRPGTRSAWPRVFRPALLVVLILASGTRAVSEVASTLAQAPHETADAASLLRRLGRPGDLVMARKPNVAFLAGLGYAPLPPATVSGYAAFLADARRSGARFLFFSAAEEETRSELAVLADSGVALPGLRPVAYRTLDPRRYYALYEFTPEPLDSAALQNGLLAALRGFAAQHPELPRAHRCLSFALLQQTEYREAAVQLAIAERLDPRDLATAGLQIVAFEQLGDPAREAAACRRAIALGASGGWERACLGRALLALGRDQEGMQSLAEAIRREPANSEYPFQLGAAHLAQGDAARAAREFERALTLNPGDVQVRLLCGRAWRSAGDRRRALRVLTGGPQMGRAQARVLLTLADSIRAEELRP